MKKNKNTEQVDEERRGHEMEWTARELYRAAGGTEESSKTDNSRNRKINVTP